MKFAQWYFKHEARILGCLLALLMLFLIATCVGCTGSDAPRVATPCEDSEVTAKSPSDIFRSIGNSMLFWGSWVGGLGVILVILSAVGVGAAIFALPFVLQIVRLAASLGAAAIIVGATMSYLADYFGLIILACVVSAIGVCVYHRNDISRAWTRVKERMIKKAAP